MSKIEDAPSGMLRAWADAGVISSARYVEEMERRRAAAGVTIRQVIEAPPLDYALEQDLDIPDLDRIEAMFDDGVAAPFPFGWLAILMMSTVIVGIALLVGSWP